MIRHQSNLRAGLIAVILLSACSGNPPVISSAEIRTAEQEGRLESLYQQLSQQRDEARPGSNAWQSFDRQRLDVGKRLADILIAELLQDGDPADKTQFLDLDTVERNLRRLEPVREWDPTRYDSLSRQYAERREQLVARITALESMLQNSAEDDYGRRRDSLRSLAELSGGEQGRQYEAQARAISVALYQDTQQALDSKRYARAQHYFAALQALDPDYPGLKELGLSVASGDYAQRFWDALGAGKTQQAYDIFVTIAKLGGGASLQEKSIADAAGDMSSYFFTLADNALKKGKLKDAYQAYSQGSYINSTLGVETKGTALKTFLQKVDKAFEDSRKKQSVASAYAYLLILEELDPHADSLTRYKRTVSEQLLSQALIKLSPAPFDSAESERAYGLAMASKISFQILQKMPDEVLIVEREKFDESFKVQYSPSTYLSYYYIEGEIPEAKVVSTLIPSNQVKRVVTGYRQVPNPALQQWKDLKRSERKITPEPPAMIDEPLYEDVEIKITRHKKDGVFSSIFRLVNPFNASVIFVDSVTERSSYEARSVEGLQLGEFRQEAEIAELRSDSEILEDLANKVAEKIAVRLEQELSDTAQRYMQYAELAIKENNRQALVENLARAHVLSSGKERDTTEISRRLKLAVLSSK